MVLIDGFDHYGSDVSSFDIPNGWGTTLTGNLMEGKSASMVIIDEYDTTMDIESGGLNDTTHPIIIHRSNRDERYGNMNRAQRRKVIAQERRALRKVK